MAPQPAWRSVEEKPIRLCLLDVGMGSLDEHVKVLREANRELSNNCPWLSGRDTDGEYTQYGEQGALCAPNEKVEGGRAAALAYQTLRHLEFNHLSKVRNMLREGLSRRRNLDEETSRFLAKDLFEKCEEILSCIDCSCRSAVSAYHNLQTLAMLLEEIPE